MKWFALIWQLCVTCGAALAILAIFGLLVYVYVGAAVGVVVVLTLTSRDLAAAGGEMISFMRFAENVGTSLIIGILWPVVPIVFAWRDLRAGDADERAEPTDNDEGPP